MIFLPKPAISIEDLPSDSRQRHEWLVDAFGQYFIWARNDTLSKIRQLIESKEAREEVGMLFRGVYEQASRLATEDREKACGLAEAAVDRFARLFLEVISDTSVDNGVGTHYELRFRIDVEICDAGAPEHVILAETINQSGAKLFPSYWGRWLKRYGEQMH
jgi:hypothetical protein